MSESKITRYVDWLIAKNQKQRRAAPDKLVLTSDVYDKFYFELSACVADAPIVPPIDGFQYRGIRIIPDRQAARL